MGKSAAKARACTIALAAVSYIREESFLPRLTPLGVSSITRGEEEVCGLDASGVPAYRLKGWEPEVWAEVQRTPRRNDCKQSTSGGLGASLQTSSAILIDPLPAIPHAQPREAPTTQAIAQTHAHEDSPYTTEHKHNKALLPHEHVCERDLVCRHGLPQRRESWRATLRAEDDGCRTGHIGGDEPGVSIGTRGAAWGRLGLGRAGERAWMKM